MKICITNDRQKAYMGWFGFLGFVGFVHLPVVDIPAVSNVAMVTRIQLSH